MTKIDLGNANNESIKDPNMVALRKYACAKVQGQKEWYLKCLECPGFDGCAVGNRAKDILEDQTKPNTDKSVDRRIEEAFKRGNPAQWLVNQGYYSNIESAKAQIRKYNKRKGLDGTTPQSRATVQKAIDRIRRIFDGAATMEEVLPKFFENVRQGTKVDSIFSAVYRWCRTYPEMAKKYPLMQELALLLNREPYISFHGTVAEYCAQMKGEKNMRPNEEDQVSVDDFLREIGDGWEQEPAKPATDVAEPSLTVGSASKKVPEVVTEAAPEKVSTGMAPSPAQLVIQKEFQRKKLEYLNKLNELKKAIAEIQQRIKLLDETAALFGMRPKS